MIFVSHNGDVSPQSYRTDVWWTEWLCYSGDLNSYWGINGGGLRTGKRMFHS